jgi:hypothetical protein
LVEGATLRGVTGAGIRGTKPVAHTAMRVLQVLTRKVLQLLRYQGSSRRCELESADGINEPSTKLGEGPRCFALAESILRTLAGVSFGLRSSVPALTEDSQRCANQS